MKIIYEILPDISVQVSESGKVKVKHSDSWEKNIALPHFRSWRHASYRYLVYHHVNQKKIDFIKDGGVVSSVHV
jgi:hypothetical protein